MSEFEVLLVPLSLVLGLGVTTVLSGLIRVIQQRDHLQIDWLPIVWSLSILAYLVGLFNVFYDIHSFGAAWSWGVFLLAFAQAMLMYFSAGLVFPADYRNTNGDMLDEFAATGRLALIPLGILLALAPFANWLQTPGPFDLQWMLSEALNVTLVVLLIFFFVSRRVFVQRTLTVLFAMLTVAGWAFLWAGPGRN